MIVHGPEAFDSGDAAWLMERLRPASVVVAGVMARTAAEESGLPVLFDCRRPSVIAREIDGPSFLVNRGKTAASGRLFGEMVAERIGRDRGLVHLESSSGTVYLWNRGDRELASALARKTGYTLVYAESARTEKAGMREIRGCIAGEAVFVNGIVVGQATAETVVLACRDGAIEPVFGMIPKPHGIEKLLRRGCPEIATAWCKSGSIRTVPPKQAEQRRSRGRILVVDHAGHTIYDRIDPGVCGVLSIGDDTTAVCGHICAHRGIPIFGVVDGDCDGILAAGYAPGSVVVEVTAGRDDDVGCDLAATLPDEDTDWEGWVRRALEHLDGTVRIVADLRGRPDAVR
ncbi:MAG: DUF2117 domain-containing protein [Methanomicrobiaceae archaeon]|nr:DUF2117 domain-containing protein [Methanomicrobiaceae archaeon]